MWGAGCETADVMFVGEAPGRAEDEGGRPFAGAAGRVLDEVLDVAGLKRDEIYIANVLKCRPPANRNPHPAEISACQHWLLAQIREIDPRVIVTLGNFATRWVLDEDVSIGSVQGRVTQRDGRWVLPLYHPAAAIYDRTKRPALHAGGEKIAEILANRSPQF